MNPSRGRRIGKETVSFETLKEKLPTECYEAVIKCEGFHNLTYVHSDLQDQFFNAKPVEILNEDEKKELFEQLGEKLIKNHYSTAQLREFLDTRNLQPRSEEIDSNFEYKEDRVVRKRNHE